MGDLQEASHPGNEDIVASNSNTSIVWKTLGLFLELKSDTIDYTDYPLLKIVLKIHNIGSGQVTGVSVKVRL